MMADEDATGGHRIDHESDRLRQPAGHLEYRSRAAAPKTTRFSVIAPGT
jgi:hypothetical protein